MKYKEDERLEDMTDDEVELEFKKITRILLYKYEYELKDLVKILLEEEEK